MELFYVLKGSLKPVIMNRMVGRPDSSYALLPLKHRHLRPEVVEKLFRYHMDWFDCQESLMFQDYPQCIQSNMTLIMDKGQVSPILIPQYPFLCWHYLWTFSLSSFYILLWKMYFPAILPKLFAASQLLKNVFHFLCISAHGQIQLNSISDYTLDQMKINSNS